METFNLDLNMEINNFSFSPFANILFADSWSKSWARKCKESNWIYTGMFNYIFILHVVSLYDV